MAEEAPRKGRLFPNMRFKLFDINADKLEKAIENEGGVCVRNIDNATHLVVNTKTITFSEGLCEASRRYRIPVVTKFWVDQALKFKELPDYTKVIYRPSKQIDGIPGCSSFKIASKGYTKHEYEEIKHITKIIGASLEDEWTERATHIVCEKLDGADLVNQNRWGTTWIKKKWLIDCVDHWKILPVPSSVVQEGEKVDLKFFWTPGPKHGKRETTNRNCDSTGNKKARAETMSVTSQRVKKSLKFSLQKIPDEAISPEPITLQKFASVAKNRVKSVHFPKSTIHQTLTRDSFKIFLLKSYKEMILQHADGLSMDGQYTAMNFLRSGMFERVTIQDVVRVTATASTNKRDRQRFVIMTESLFDEDIPLDVKGWLKSIREGWPEEVNLNHINMVHSCSALGEFMNMNHCLITVEKNDIEVYNEIKELISEHDSWGKKKLKWPELQINRTQKDSRTRRVIDYEVHGAPGLIHLIRNTWEHQAKAYLEEFLAIVLNENKDILGDLQRALQEKGYLPQHGLQM